MKPMEQWIDALENRYWWIRGRLRGPVNDPQIWGDGFCAIGVLCDIFLKSGDEGVAASKARWDKGSGSFVWEESGVERSQWAEDAVPTPVLKWWSRHHPLDLSGIITANDFLNSSFRELAMYLRGASGMSYLTAK